MTRKKDNFTEWLKERRARKRAKRQRRKERILAKKEAERTWKSGKIITLQVNDGRRFICRMMKIPINVKVHFCTFCSMINGHYACLDKNGYYGIQSRCRKKRAINVIPFIILKPDKHGQYRKRSFPSHP